MITITRQILISAPKESVQMYLRDLSNMAEYEQKVESVDATYPDPESGLVEVEGRFLGLPWKGAFKMEFTRDGGFRSEMIRGPLKRMVGGYHLRPVAGGTLLTHDEQYHFPMLIQPVMRFFRGWISRTIDLELSTIKEGAERLNRLIQLKNIEAIG
jgi:hypothetical protein